MQNYDGLRLTPIFHSEISSSYLLYEIFNNHKEVAKSFLNQFLGFEISNINIDRERNYTGKGSVDLFFNFDNNGRETHVLMEIKVHDYLSATKGQICTYYEAASEELVGGDVYFIYLTQFNKANRPNSSEVSLPPTIQEFEDSKSHLGEEKLRHLNWEQIHDFISPYKTHFTNEEQLMIKLQETWIKKQTIKDIEENTDNVGERNISDYFDDIKFNLEEELNFGGRESKKDRVNYVIKLADQTREKLDKVLAVIELYSDSERVIKSSVKNTGYSTLQAVKDFMSDLVQDKNNWNLLRFYSSLFDYINKKNYLELHGTGRSGFSIRVKVRNKGNISLCTLRKNKTIEFGLQR